jgi:hypothetical protein
MLMGCSLAPFVGVDAIDYSNTVEVVTNNLLVTNVLRGRDSAPLYFADLSQIRGQLNASLSAQTTIPVGANVVTNGPRILLGQVFPWNTQAGPLSASTAPSFDIAPTNTRKFYQGLLQPISENIFQYFIEQKIAGNSELYFYLLVDSIDVEKFNLGWRDERDFDRIADRWTDGGHIPRVVKLPAASKDFGPPLPPDAKAVVQASSAGLDVKGTLKDGIQLVQFQKKDGGRALCFFDGPGYVRVSVEENSVTKAPSGEALSSQSGKAGNPCAKLLRTRTPPQPYVHYTLHLRSVEQIFYYLGTLINTRSTYGLRTEGPLAGCPRIPFFIDTVPSDYTRFAVNYRGAVYYVADTSRRIQCAGGANIGDYTMPILAALNDLLNLNRDADEVPTTKAVTAVGG